MTTCLLPEPVMDLVVDTCKGSGASPLSHASAQDPGQLMEENKTILSSVLSSYAVSCSGLPYQDHNYSAPPEGAHDAASRAEGLHSSVGMSSEQHQGAPPLPGACVPQRSVNMGFNLGRGAGVKRNTVKGCAHRAGPVKKPPRKIENELVGCEIAKAPRRKPAQGKGPLSSSAKVAKKVKASSSRARRVRGGKRMKPSKNVFVSSSPGGQQPVGEGKVGERSDTDWSPGPPPHGAELEEICVAQQAHCNSPQIPATDDSVTRCICGYTHDDGFMICCDRCSVWQHIDCLGIRRERIPDTYLCELCEPRRVNRLKAKRLQKMKVNELSIAKDARSAAMASCTSNLQPSRDFTTTIHEGTNMRYSRAKKNNQFRTTTGDSAAKYAVTANTHSCCRESTDRSSVSDVPPLVYEHHESYETYEEATCNQYSPEVLHVSACCTAPGSPTPSFAAPPVDQDQISEDLLGRLLSLDKPVYRVHSLANRRHCLKTCRAVPTQWPIEEYKGKVKLGQHFMQEHDWHKKSCPYVMFHQFDNMSLCIDATVFGNKARFIRRSCVPNTEVRHVTSKGGIHFLLVAIKDIGLGAEITLPFDLDFLQCEYYVECACHRAECPVRKYNKRKEYYPSGKAPKGKSRLSRSEMYNRSTRDWQSSIGGTTASSPIAEKKRKCSSLASLTVDIPPPSHLSSSSTVIEGGAVLGPFSEGVHSGGRVRAAPLSGPMGTRARGPPHSADELHEGSRHKSREDRKMEAIMRAFEKLEKREERRKEALARSSAGCTIGDGGVGSAGSQLVTQQASAPSTACSHKQLQKTDTIEEVDVGSTGVLASHLSGSSDEPNSQETTGPVSVTTTIPHSRRKDRILFTKSTPASKPQKALVARKRGVSNRTRSESAVSSTWASSPWSAQSSKQEDPNKQLRPSAGPVQEDSSIPANLVSQEKGAQREKAASDCAPSYSTPLHVTTDCCEKMSCPGVGSDVSPPLNHLSPAQGLPSTAMALSSPTVDASRASAKKRWLRQALIEGDSEEAGGSAPLSFLISPDHPQLSTSPPLPSFKSSDDAPTLAPLSIHPTSQVPPTPIKKRWQMRGPLSPADPAGDPGGNSSLTPPISHHSTSQVCTAPTLILQFSTLTPTLSPTAPIPPCSLTASIPNPSPAAIPEDKAHSKLSPHVGNQSCSSPAICGPHGDSMEDSKADCTECSQDSRSPHKMRARILKPCFVGCTAPPLEDKNPQAMPHPAAAAAAALEGQASDVNNDQSLPQSSGHHSSVEKSTPSKLWEESKAVPSGLLAVCPPSPVCGEHVLGSCTGGPAPGAGLGASALAPIRRKVSLSEYRHRRRSLNQCRPASQPASTSVTPSGSAPAPPSPPPLSGDPSLVPAVEVINTLPLLSAGLHGQDTVKAPLQMPTLDPLPLFKSQPYRLQSGPQSHLSSNSVRPSLRPSLCRAQHGHFGLKQTHRSVDKHSESALPLREDQEGSSIHMGVGNGGKTSLLEVDSTYKEDAHHIHKREVRDNLFHHSKREGECVHSGLAKPSVAPQEAEPRGTPLPQQTESAGLHSVAHRNMQAHAHTSPTGTWACGSLEERLKNEFGVGRSPVSPTEMADNEGALNRRSPSQPHGDEASHPMAHYPAQQQGPYVERRQHSWHPSS